MLSNPAHLDQFRYVLLPFAPNLLGYRRSSDLILLPRYAR